MPIISKVIESADNKIVRNGDMAESFARFIVEANLGFAFEKREGIVSFITNGEYTICVRSGYSNYDDVEIIFTRNGKTFNGLRWSLKTSSSMDYSAKIWIIYTQDKKNITFFGSDASKMYDELPDTTNRLSVFRAYHLLEKKELIVSSTNYSCMFMSEDKPFYISNDKTYPIGIMGYNYTPKEELKEYAYVSDLAVSEYPIILKGIKHITFRNVIDNRLYKIGEENYYLIGSYFYNY